MLVQRLSGFALVCAICCFTAGCGEKQAGPKITKVPVVPVKGEVTVDGNPEAGVVLTCVPQGAGAADKKILNATTDENGKFTFTTYEVGDGLPLGEYAVTFLWPPVSTFTKKRVTREEEVESDRLHGKYASAKDSPLKFTAEAGKPLALDTVDLQTK